MNDCAWCGTGNGICDMHMNALFAQSAELAATGRYLAEGSPNVENEKHEGKEATQGEKNLSR